MNNCLLLRRKIGQIVSFRSEPSSPLMSILCGVIGAVAVVYIMLEIIESSSGVPESVSNCSD